MRSGTSIGSHVEEAIGSESRADFAHTMSIAYKAAREVHYWIKLLTDEHVIPSLTGNALRSEAEQLIKILYRIQKTTRTLKKDDP